MNTPEQQTENVFIQVLTSIIEKDDTRVWMSKPFNLGNKTASTNGHCLIATPLQDGFEDRSKKTESVYPMQHTMSKRISINELNQKIKDLPLVDCFDEVEAKCDACYGSGEVEFEFYFDSQAYESEQECPVCEGHGATYKESDVPNGKKELDYNNYFKIGNSIFNMARIQELVFVAEKLKASHFTMVNQTVSNKASLFTVNDVEVLLMPCRGEDAQNKVQIIGICSLQND